MSKLISTYPYPVLRPNSNDYINEEFTVSCSASALPGDRYQFSFSVTNTSRLLNELIAEGKAVYLLRFVCKTTMFRNSFTFADSAYKVQIPRKDLLNEVTIETMIISLADIDNFFSESFNPDYEGLDLSVKVGDRLAIGRSIRFDAPQQQEIGATPDSIIRFQRDSKENAPLISVTTYSDYIYIKLRPDEAMAVALLRNPKIHWEGENSLVWSVFVIPALTQVLMEYFNAKTSTEEEQDKWRVHRWYRVIRDRLAELNVLKIGDDGYIINDQKYADIGINPILYAEMLIDNPLLESAESMRKIAFPENSMNDRGDDDGY